MMNFPQRRRADSGKKLKMLARDPKSHSAVGVMTRKRGQKRGYSGQDSLQQYSNGTATAPTPPTEQRPQYEAGLSGERPASA
jgi:hypothetical protein